MRQRQMSFTAGNILGGTANRVAIFDSTNTMTTDANLAYNASTNILSGMAGIESSSALTIGTTGSVALNFKINNGNQWGINTSGHWVPVAGDNGRDLGLAGTRVRSGYFGTSVGIIGTVSGTGTLALGNGTAPTAQADTVHAYSTDDVAGHTIPSFMCEGTNVIATGQTDSASSVRVKMRINGTVVTLLAI